jgi:hypothetical protein
MSEMKSYTAGQSFSINSDSNKDAFDVKAGDRLLFGEVNVEHGGNSKDNVLEIDATIFCDSDNK